MTLYRTITGDYPCGQCHTVFEADVQFRTGLDNLETYQAEQPLPADHSLPTEVTFVGIGPFYCSACIKQREALEIEFFHQALKTFIENQELLIKSGWLIKKVWDVSTVEQHRQDLNKKRASGQYQANQLFGFLRTVNLTWKGDIAIQGNMAYTNLLETLNQHIREEFYQADWTHHGLLRHDVDITVTPERTIQLQLPQTTDEKQAAYSV